MIAFFFLYNDGLSQDEWLATAATIALSLWLFIVGAPAFVLQALIPYNLRDIYYERVLKPHWQPFIIIGALTFILFFIGEPHIPKGLVSALVAIILVLIVLGLSFDTLGKIFPKYILHLIKTVVESAGDHYQKQNVKELNKDIEHLTVIAAELHNGELKRGFLEQCEKLIEKIIETEKSPKYRHGVNYLYVHLRDILQEVLCRSVANGSDKASSENRRKALDLLVYTYNRLRSFTDKSPLTSIIAHCMEKIGLSALELGDRAALIDAVDKVSKLPAQYKHMFILANRALFSYNQVEATLAAIHNLRKALRQHPDDIFVFYYWLGLLANLHVKGGSAQKYAERELSEFRGILSLHKMDEAYEYFLWRMGYFDTADSVRWLQQHYFSPA